MDSMKHTKVVTYGTLLKSACIAFIAFFISVSFAFAQTGTESQVQDAERVRTVNAVQDDDAERKFIRPDMLIDKARDVLLQKREAQKENGELRTREIEERKNNVEERSSNTETRKDDRADSAVRNEKADRIASYLENVSKKMTAAVERLDILSGRIESRINKLEERGVDMTKAKELLQTARARIREAGESLSMALSQARETLTIDISRDSFGKAVATLAQAKEKLRDAHQALVEAIRAMKAGLEQDEQETNDIPGTEIN